MDFSPGSVLLSAWAKLPELHRIEAQSPGLVHENIWYEAGIADNITIDIQHYTTQVIYSEYHAEIY